MTVLLILAFLAYFNPEAGIYMLGLYGIKWIGQLTLETLKVVING